MAERQYEDVGPGKEFPTLSHRMSFIEALEREIRGRQHRLDEQRELEEKHGTVGRRNLEQTENELEAAKANLARLGGPRGANRRPRRAEQTRA